MARMSRDMGIMSRIADYVRQKGEVSMGEVELQLYVPGWKQYVVHRMYGRMFPDVELYRGTWHLRPIPPETVVPPLAQDTLSAKF
jgi:hypothetical protein